MTPADPETKLPTADAAGHRGPSPLVPVRLSTAVLSVASGTEVGEGRWGRTRAYSLDVPGASEEMRPGRTAHRAS